MKQTIDFEYAFAEPHTLTLCRPSASEKVLVNAQKAVLHIYWTYASQKNDFPLAWTQHPLDVEMFLTVSVDKKLAELSRWRRHESGLPYLFANGEKDGVNYTLSGIATKYGTIFKTEAVNNASEKKDVFFQMSHINMWVISNKGWIDGVHNNVLLTMNQGRADRIITVAKGADEYPMYGCNKDSGEKEAPMSVGAYGIADHSMKKVTSLLQLEAGEKKHCYFFIPYKLYFDDLSFVDTLDFEAEMSKALKEWERQIKKGAKLEIPDEQFMHCYNACLADMFVMREKIGKYTGITCGTHIYRSASSGEPLEAEILLDMLGYTKEALKDYRMYLEAQEKDGCWATRKGWEHEGWAIIFNKANAVITHYELTKDKKFLEEYYPRMYASVKYNHSMRQTTKNAEKEAERGLMPKGMGDCGMMNYSDFYGVFYPSNVLCLASDFYALKAAKILGKKKDIAELEQICEEAKAALLKSMRENVIQEDGYVRTSAIANAPVCSIYGCLYSYFPANLVGKDEPMIDGAVRYIETKQRSEGGLPIGTGWQKDGIWVAMALNNISRAYLRMGYYEKARQYLYPALNHATPVVTWCEERGAEKNAQEKSGDLQHLWTPLSVLQYMADAFYLENEGKAYLFTGICPEWLEDGNKVAIKGLKTPYGDTELSLQRKADGCHLRVKTERQIDKPIVLHYFTKDGKDCTETFKANSTVIEKIFS